MLKKKHLQFRRLSFDKYFKNTYNGVKLAKHLDRNVSSQDILITPTITSFGTPVSSSDYNQYYINTSYNIENINTLLKELSNSVNNNDFSYGFSLLKEGYDLTNSLLLLEKGTNNLLFNFFLNKGFQLQRITDALTGHSLSERFYMSYMAGKGMTFSNKFSTLVPIVNISPNFDESQIGEEIVEEYNENIDGKKSYSIVFLSQDSNKTGNVFTRKEDYYFTLNIDIPGFQEFNRVKINSLRKFKIKEINYLSYNETINSLSDFTFIEELGTTTLTFDKIIASNLTITFSISNPIDTVIKNESLYKVYSFSFDNIELMNINYNEYSYLVTKTNLINSLRSLRIFAPSTIDESEYLKDIYVYIDVPTKKFLIPLKENYLAAFKIPLYFRNKVADLFYCPSSLTLYKDEKELRLGTDYWINSSIEEDPIVALTDIDPYKKQTLSIELDTFDANSYYYSLVVPNLKSKIYGDYYYNNNSLIFEENISTASLQFLVFLRKIKTTSDSLPIIKSLNVKINVV